MIAPLVSSNSPYYKERYNLDLEHYILFYYCLLLRELFSYSVVWWGIVPEPTAKALYLTRQHYKKTVPEEEDNMFST